MQVKPTEDNEDVSDKGKIRVFVYGTLKKGFGNNILLQNAEGQFIGHDSIFGHYQMHSMGSFPAVINLPGSNVSSRIFGELWTINEDGLHALDLLEGNPHFYARRKIWTDTLKKRAWTYFLTEAWHEEILEELKVPDNIWRPNEDDCNVWGIKFRGAAK